MKASGGFIELVLTLSMMTASVPLLLLLISILNNSNINFINDKSTTGLESAIEYKTVTDSDTGALISVPTIDGQIPLEYADVLLSYLIYDEYAPENNKVAVYNSDPIDMTTLDNTVRKFDYFSSRYYNTSNPLNLNLSAYKTRVGNWYMHWDQNKNCWRLTQNYKTIW